MRKLKTGDTIDTFQLLEPILQKKDLEIWFCTDGSGKKMVVKLLGASIKSGLREADLSTKLMEIHPDNLLIPKSVRTTGELFYQVMDPCDSSLYDLIKDRSALSITTSKDPNAKKPLFSLHESIKIINDIFGGLTTLHSHRLVHLDVKPSNILIKEEDNDFVFLLADFDNVRDLDKTISREKLKEDHGISPYYAAPEQLLREDYYAEMCSDIYSAGITLFETLTGENIPYGGSKEEKELKLRESQAAYLLSKYQFEPEVLSILQQCLSFDKNERPTAKELYGLTKYYIDSGHWPDADANLVKSEASFSTASMENGKKRGKRKWLVPTLVVLAVLLVLVTGWNLADNNKPGISDINTLLLVGGKGNLLHAKEITSDADLKKGLQTILDRDYRNVRGMNEEIFAVQNEDGFWGFTHYSGNIITPCQYEDVTDFKNGLAIVLKENKIGVINSIGAIEIEPEEYGKRGEILEGGRVKLGNEIIELKQR